MAETFTYKPEGVCSRQITITHENGVILHIEFVGGCQGNTQGVARLAEGRKIEEVIPLIEGIKCRGGDGGRTSCPDQLAKALRQIA